MPIDRLYDPRWELGSAARWAIGMADGEPFCVAGLWKAWPEEQGGFSFSFTQLTLNVDEHTLMKRFHKLGDGKRSLVSMGGATSEGHLKDEGSSKEDAMGKLSRGRPQSCS